MIVVLGGVQQVYWSVLDEERKRGGQVMVQGSQKQKSRKGGMKWWGSYQQEGHAAET